MAPRHIIAALALLIVVAVIMAQNGAGRATGDDKTRMSDLRDLSGFVRCTAELNDDKLPSALAPLAQCGQRIRLADPSTGVAYGYRKIDATTYEVCAPFDKPERLTDSWYGVGSFDPTTGCATVPFGS